VLSLLLDRFVHKVNAYKKNQRDLNIWVGEAHGTPQGNYLTVNLSTEITFQNFIKEAIDANVDERPEKNPEIIQCAGWKTIAPAASGLIHLVSQGARYLAP
jgi:hypothetical protein